MGINDKEREMKRNEHQHTSADLDLASPIPIYSVWFHVSHRLSELLPRWVYDTSMFKWPISYQDPFNLRWQFEKVLCSLPLFHSLTCISSSNLLGHPKCKSPNHFIPFPQQGIIGSLDLCLHSPNSPTHSAALSSVQHCLEIEECGWRGLVGKFDICSPSDSHALDLSFNVRAQNCSLHSRNPSKCLCAWSFQSSKVPYEVGTIIIPFDTWENWLIKIKYLVYCHRANQWCSQVHRPQTPTVQHCPIL